MKRLLICLSAVLLSACQTPATYEGQEDSPYYVVPAGSRVALNREITIAADQLAVYIQGGRILPRPQLNSYHPYCKFELRDLSPEPRPVAPDDFTVTRVHLNVFYSRAAYLRLADIDDDGTGIWVYTTIMELQSARQPEVSRLLCEQWNVPPDSYHVSITEMRRTLDELFSLRISSK
jgi:hypothetical protein